ncbi:MAG: helix-turn-helix domain-containing protein [Oscillospiraceae bacterium]|nr:helix-turn-helix domain-containing protein [Oscillospiraceae bacterium]
MSSRILQSVIVQMKDATTRPMGVIDANGTVIASNELSMIGSYIGVFVGGNEDSNEKTVRSYGRTFRFIGGNGHRFDYAVFVDGEDDYARTICIMAYVAICEAKANYEENHDNSTFVKNIISNNMLPGDVYVRAKELHFPSDITRVVLLVRIEGKTESSALEVVQSMFPDKQNDFVFSVGENDIAVIKLCGLPHEVEQAGTLAAGIERKLASELNLKCTIGIGTPAQHLRELSDRFKEAQVAIEVGKVFETEKTIINYETLGIGRLIYQLPTTLCEMFLSEIFQKNPIEALDEETLFTINKFFENNLNVSETSRKLFVHRNTLVYRLEKIKKLTGLDLREFDSAIVFKVAMMVRQYLDSQYNVY